MLPEHIILEIFSYYNPHKNYFTKSVLIELKQSFYFKNLMKQLRQFVTYNKEKNIIKFHKYSIISKNNT